MEEGKRQKQVAGLLREELGSIFQRLGITIIDGAMISISDVKITPDLLEARIYLSIFKAADSKALLKRIEETRGWEIKKELTTRLGKQLRRMPELKYFLDDTLDQVFRMEELFKSIEEKKKD